MSTSQNCNSHLAGPLPDPQAGSEPTPLVPFTIELPDEVLRTVFEIAVEERRHEAKQLMLVARWVRLWLVQTYFATLRVITKKQVQKLLLRPASLLAHIKALHVGLYHQRLVDKLLESTPYLERLAIRSEAFIPPSTPTSEAESERSRFADNLQATLRELEITFIGQLDTISTAVFDFSPTAFNNVTHARLGLPYLSILRQLERQEDPVLPSLTHLAFDVSNVALHLTRTRELGPVIDALQAMVSSPARSNLQVLALELEPVTQKHMRNKPVYFRSGRLYVRYYQWGGAWWYDGRRYWLELALPKSKVLQMTKEKAIGRRADWNARGLGRKGFWERVEECGEVALPRPTDEGYTSDSQ